MDEESGPEVGHIVFEQQMVEVMIYPGGVEIRFFDKKLRKPASCFIRSTEVEAFGFSMTEIAKKEGWVE